MLVNKTHLSNAVVARLGELGLADDDARSINGYLLDAEERGYPSHGYMRLPSIVSILERNGPGGPGTVERVGRSVALYDANTELGILSMHHATQLAADLADEHGLALVAAMNYRGTTGTLAPHLRGLADRGLAAISMCSSEYAVAPTGGRRAILGTNPIGIAFPGQGSGFVTDFATAAWSYGDLRLAMQRSETIPEGVVLSENGLPSTDPNDADNGAQLPMAGHKGYGLGLAIELLCGPLIGAKAGRDAVHGSDGLLILAIKADLFRARGLVEADFAALADELRESPLATGSSGVSIPGERSAKAKLRAQTESRLELAEDLIARSGIRL